MNKYKTWFIRKLHKGNELIHYKRSYKHPMLNKNYHNIDYGFCKIDRVWNCKTYNKHCEFNYEKNKHVNWTQKVRIITDCGIYIIPLYQFVLKSTEKDGKKIDDSMIYCLFK